MKKTIVLSMSMLFMVTANFAHGERISLVVTRNHCDGGQGIIGSFDYNPSTNVFMTGMFGYGTALRLYNANSDTSETYVWATDLELFGRASDPLGGITSSNHSGNASIFGCGFNPKTLQIGDLTYNPGELVYLINYCGAILEDGITPHMEWTKAVFRWDLRMTGDVTDVEPDYDNAENGDGTVTGAYGVVDWNDNLATVATNRDFVDAALAVDPDADEERPFIGRQFSWDSDGSGIYLTSHGSYSFGTGGIYYVDAVTGDVTYIHPQARIYSEPYALSSMVRDLQQGPGDQVIYGGTNCSDQWTDDGGLNDGGLSFIVDDGITVSAEQILVSGADMRVYVERSDEDGDGNLGEETDIGSVTADTNGVIYFYEKKSNAIHMLDNSNRLACVANNAQIEAFARSIDGTLANYGGMYRLQTRDVDGKKQLMYRGDNAYIAGITIERIGDFDTNGALNELDTEFFIDQFRRSFDTLPNYYDGQTYLDYIAADVNGNSSADSSGVLAGPCVTDKDFEILKQFINWQSGDFNWDGAVNAADYGIFSANLDSGGEKTVFDGDANGDGKVDLKDYQYLQIAYGNAYELDPELE